MRPPVTGRTKYQRIKNQINFINFKKVYPTVSGYFSMATKKANNNSEYQKSMAQYKAVAEYAQSVYKHVVGAEEYDRPMSAKEVQKELYRHIFISDEGGYDDEKKHTIEADGMSVCTTPKESFALVVQFESMLKIKPADRAVFMHEYTPAKKDIFGVCVLPEKAKEVAACCADDILRPVMQGVYVDFDEKMIIGSDGHVLRGLPITGDCRVVCDVEHLGAIIPADFVRRHGGEEILICGDIIKQKENGKENGTVIYNVKYAYCGKERAKLIEGRYPNWKSVVPKYNVAQSIGLGEVWPKLRDAIKGMSKVMDGGTVVLEGKEAKQYVTVRAKNEDTGVDMKKNIEMPCPLAFDFAIGVSAEYTDRIDGPTSMSMQDATRAIVFTNGIIGETQDFTLLMPRLIDVPGWDQWSTKERAEKYAKAAAKEQKKAKPEEKVWEGSLAQYADIKKKHPDAVLLFRVGDFYEMYHEDAKVGADILGITLTMRHGVGMATFPHHAIDTYLPKLVRAGKRVAICDLLEDPKSKIKNGTKVNEVVSPAPANEPTQEPVCETPTETPTEAPTVTPATEAPAEPKVIAIGTEVCVKGDTTKEVWRVEMMSEQRAILKGVYNPSHRRVEKRENLYVAGTTEEPATVSGERVAVSEEPVCEPTTEAPADVQPETVTPEAVAIGAVYVCSYSEKAILVFGDTKKYRKALKKYGTWIAKYEGWCLSKKRMDYVKRVVGDKLQETTTMPQAKVSTKNAA